jgi:hypothetical protein
MQFTPLLLIYDVVHYKHFFRDHNNLVILKKRKSGGTLALFEKDSYLSVSESVSQ